MRAVIDHLVDDLPVSDCEVEPWVLRLISEDRELVNNLLDECSFFFVLL